MNHLEDAVTHAEISPEQHEMILATLRSVLDSPHFCKSKRYPALLEFSVRAALEVDAHNLKERTVGVEVFGRPAEYDTSNDPVVRIAAGEVRRRMALYFSEHPEEPVRINLPVGSYRAEFHFQPLSLGDSVFHSLQAPVPVDASPEVLPTGAQDVHDVHVSPAASLPESRSTRLRWNKRLSLIIATALLLVGGAVLGSRLYDSARRDFWGPVLHGQAPALILVGKTGTIPAAATTGQAQQAVADDSSGQASLVMEDAVVVAQICSVFREYKRDCNIAPAQATRVEDIRNKSVVLVGGFSNPWTERLLAPLPFHLQGDPAHSARVVIEHKPTGDVQLGKISEADSPSRFGKDYAIVARFHSDITDSMAVVVAGLGIPGTSSAGQYVSSGDEYRALVSRAPKDWKGVNFEAVLQIDVVQGSAGHVEVIASHFW